MTRLWVSALAVVVGAVATAGAASAQTSPGAGGTPTVQHSPGGIDYISGGAGEEDRTAMTTQQARFPFKVVLSAAGGEYLVADKLSVATPQGELLTVRNAGPIVMMKLAPGQYTLEATWKGRTERRSVSVGAPAQTVNWQLPG